MVDKNKLSSYKKYLFDHDLPLMRKVAILSLVLYSAFGVMDYYLEVSNYNIFIIIRFYVFAPFMFLVYLLSFSKSFYKTHQFLLTISYTIGGLGIVYMLVLDQDNYSYYGGLFLIFAVGYFLLRVNWKFVSLGSIIIMGAYFAFALANQFDSTLNALLYSIFYLVFNFIGIFGSFTLSNIRYKNYLHEITIIDDKHSLQMQNDQNIVNLEISNYATIYSLARLAESKDHFTGNHLDRVGELALNLAQEIDESVFKKNDIVKADFLKSIEHASKLHDIGKIGISEEILMKPGIYTPEERLIMQEHSKIGSGTLYQIKKLYPRNAYINMGIQIAQSHHENWNGTGYPEGLTGQAIPFSARLVSVIDVYDALTNERPYKKEFSHQEAILEIKSLSGIKFDPEIVEVFLETCHEKR